MEFEIPAIYTSTKGHGVTAVKDQTSIMYAYIPKLSYKLGIETVRSSLTLRCYKITELLCYFKIRTFENNFIRTIMQRYYYHYI